MFVWRCHYQFACQCAQLWTFEISYFFFQLFMIPCCFKIWKKINFNSILTALLFTKWNTRFHKIDDLLWKFKRKAISTTNSHEFESHHKNEKEEQRRKLCELTETKQQQQIYFCQLFNRYLCYIGIH